MASVNKIILLGTVTTAPDFRVLSGGSMMVSLQMETTVGEETESHDVTFYGRLAEIVMQYVAEGSVIFVEGKIRSRQYRDKNGVERLVTDIVSQKCRCSDGKKISFPTRTIFFPKDNPYKKAREGRGDPPDLSRFEI